MKILYGLLYETDSAWQFMCIFLLCSLVVLPILHHFLKEKIKMWAAICAVPLMVYITFMLKEYYRGDPELTAIRYAAFGVVALFIALWGLSILKKHSYIANTIVLVVCSVIILIINLLAIWAVWLRPNVANYSHLGWKDSFEKTIDYMEQEYILNDWKEIDYDKIRKDLIWKVEVAERNNDEIGYAAALYELKYKFHDGHVTVRGDMGVRNQAIERLAGNDYGFSMFRASSGEVVAILVDESSECYQRGIRNGTVITKWDNVPVEEAAEEVKCIDREHAFMTWENIHLAQPIFLAGQGEETVNVSFINDAGEEETAELSASGSYINRRSEALRILFNDNVISGENYSTRMLNENVGYLRITEEEYSTDPGFVIKSTIGGFSQDLYDDLDKRLEEMRARGMDRIILDIRNNDGGYGYESRTVASLFTPNPGPYNLTLYKDGKYEVVKEAEDINKGKYSDIPVVVLLNGQTCSAGEVMMYLLKDCPNVQLVGNTESWGAVQGTGGSVVLTDSRFEFRFPITPTVDDDHLPYIDPKADYHARLTVDKKITFTKEEVVDYFSNPTEDKVLEEAIEIIQEMD